jgi:hypothetical protein
MAIDIATVNLLQSVLGPPAVRKLFTTIADMRIVDMETLKADYPEANLDALQQANLIDVGNSGKRYYVTAKGLKVARDIAKLHT